MRPNRLNEHHSTLTLGGAGAPVTSPRHSGLSGLRGDMSEVKESPARIEVTQQAHGEQLARTADHGERIAAAEAALAAAS